MACTTECRSSCFGCSVIGGERIAGDRAGELTATGTVANLHTVLGDIVTRLADWVKVTVTAGFQDRTALPTATPERTSGRSKNDPGSPIP